MRIIRIAGKKIRILFRIGKTGLTEMIAQEAYTDEHLGIENVMPTTQGRVTPNDPADFPKTTTAIPDEGDIQRDVMTL